MQQNFEIVLGKISERYAEIESQINSNVEDTHRNEGLRKQLLGATQCLSKSTVFGGGELDYAANQLVFIEFNCPQNPELNDFINSNNTKIRSYCKKNLLHDFASLNGVVSRIDIEQVEYFRPRATQEFLSDCEQRISEVFRREWHQPICRKIGYAEDQPIRGLVSFLGESLVFYPVDGETGEQMISNFVRALFLALPGGERCQNDAIDYRGWEKPSIDDADNQYPDAFHLLLEDVQAKIHKMEGFGVERNIILGLLDRPILSRMVITADFRIILIDFDNVEISMPPLAKTLYLFYLKHPEGVLFCHLHIYFNQIFKIYKAVSNRENYDEMVESIMTLVDTSQNSVNENRSRIRSVFLREFCDSIASQYYITGYGRDKKKGIELDRSMVDFQCEI